jgi:SAM-dependent methyltransferase
MEVDPITAMPTNRYSSDLERLERQAERVAGVQVRMLRAHGLEPGMDVLDVGCGTGGIARAIARVFEGTTVWGVDLDAGAVARAAEGAPPHLRFQQADATALPFEDQSFDFVHISLVLMHVRDPLAVLREGVRVLRPGGRLFVLDTDDACFLFEPPCTAFERLKALLAAMYDHHGGTRQRGRQLPGLLREAGLREIDAAVTILDSTTMGEEDFHATFLGIFRAQMDRIVEAGLVDAELGERLLARLDLAADGPYFSTIAGFTASGVR